MAPATARPIEPVDSMGVADHADARNRANFAGAADKAGGYLGASHIDADYVIG